VLQSSNKGTPAILDEETDVAQAYLDVVRRFLGEEREHRFIEEEKRGIFRRLFGWVTREPRPFSITSVANPSQPAWPKTDCR